MRAGLLPAVLIGILIPRAASAQATWSGETFEANLGYKSGIIVLRRGIASLNVPSSFRYIDHDAAQRLIELAWRNPPGSADDVLGMLIPANVSPLDAEGWGIVIRFDEDGHVDDGDAASINYDELLREMQASIPKGRRRGGESVRLVGWAEPPSYNPETHQLYWAKELEFGGDPAHTLNYDVRILGRRGVLVLSAVAGMNQLAAIRGHMKAVLGFVEFSRGHQYADYVPGTDKKATYGIAALVAGALAGKKGLLAILLGAKKLIALALAGIGALGVRIFRNRNNQPVTAPVPTRPASAVRPPPTQSFKPRQ